MPLDYRLKNGDIVEIVTTKGEHGPSRDWLNIVRTSHAREKIRQWFKKKDRAENIVHGRESLERELRRLARTSIQAVGLDRVAEVAKTYQHDSVDDFYAAIGYGAISAQQVVMRLGVLDDGETVAADDRAAAAGPHRRRAGQGGGGPPGPLRQVLPPDPGRPDPGLHHPRQGHHGPPDVVPDGAQRARGQRASSTSSGRRRPAQTYPIAIRVEAYDRTGLLSDITQVMAENKVNILAANVGVNPDHTAMVAMTIQVASVAQLAKVMSRVEQLKDVISVQRDLG